MSDFAPYNVPIVYDQSVAGTLRPDLITFDLSENVLARPIPWAFPMPIGGAGIERGALIGTIASNGLSLTIGGAIGHLVGVTIPLNVLVTKWHDWYPPSGTPPTAEWEITMQSPGAGGDRTLGAGGAGAYQLVAVTNIQAAGYIRFIPGMIGAGSATLLTGAQDATPSKAVIYDSLTPPGDLVSCPGEGFAATAALCNVGRGGDTREPARPDLSPHIILSSYYPYDGGDSGRFDAQGFACGGISYSGGPRNIPGGGGAAGSGGGVVGSSFPGGGYGLDGAMAVTTIRRLV